jgi:broad specificity phosphatase PhoE
MITSTHRAKQTAEIILQELKGERRRKQEATRSRSSSSSSKSLLTLDTDLREISGGVREGRLLTLSLKEATAQAAHEQVRLHSR